MEENSHEQNQAHSNNENILLKKQELEHSYQLDQIYNWLRTKIDIITKTCGPQILTLKRLHRKFNIKEESQFELLYTSTVEALTEELQKIHVMLDRIHIPHSVQDSNTLHLSTTLEQDKVRILYQHETIHKHRFNNQIERLNIMHTVMYQPITQLAAQVLTQAKTDLENNTSDINTHLNRLHNDLEQLASTTYTNELFTNVYEYIIPHACDKFELEVFKAEKNIQHIARIITALEGLEKEFALYKDLFTQIAHAQKEAANCKMHLKNKTNVDDFSEDEIKNLLHQHTQWIRINKKILNKQITKCTDQACTLLCMIKNFILEAPDDLQKLLTKQFLDISLSKTSQDPLT